VTFDIEQRYRTLYTKTYVKFHCCRQDKFFIKNCSRTINFFVLFTVICASAIHKENIIAFPLQQCLDVCSTMLRHTVLYSGIFSSDTRHCHRGSPYTIQCHLEVLTHCYQKRTRNVVPSRRHSPHLCAVTLFSGSAKEIIAVVILHYANTILYIDLCLWVGQI
jgi:hypothetical protein